MSKADDLFIAMCKDIIENGYDTKGEKGASEMGGWDFGIYDQTVWCCKPI